MKAFLVNLGLVPSEKKQQRQTYIKVTNDPGSLRDKSLAYSAIPTNAFLARDYPCDGLLYIIDALPRAKFEMRLVELDKVCARLVRSRQHRTKLVILMLNCKGITSTPRCRGYEHTAYFCPGESDAKIDEKIAEIFDTEAVKIRERRTVLLGAVVLTTLAGAAWAIWH